MKIRTIVWGIILLSGLKASAEVDVGVKLGQLAESDFETIGGLYLNYSAPVHDWVRWRVGGDVAVAIMAEDEPYYEYTHYALKLALYADPFYGTDRMVHPYAGGGLGGIRYTMKGEIPGSGGGPRTVFVGGSGERALWNTMLTSMGETSGRPGRKLKVSNSVLGLHGFVGIRIGTFFHIECMYEVVQDDDFDLNTFFVRMGFTF